MKNRLIVALDTDDDGRIDWLSSRLRDTVGWFKMGFQALSALGMEAFQRFEQNGHNVFVDLKFHDIPNTVARDVGMMTKHGGADD